MADTTLTAELSARGIKPLTADNVDAVGDRTARAKIAVLESSLANILAQVQILQGGFRTVYFAAAAYSVTEGNSGTTLLTATMKRTGDLSQSLAVTAKFVQGTLTASDFASGTLPGDLVFNFAAGSDTATASDQIKGDTEVESTETLTRVIVPPPGYLFGPTPSYTGSVLNDDTATTPANGDMSALRVRDATPMDTHDNGTNVVGIDGNGWIAEVTIKGMTAPAADNTSDGFFNCQKLELLVADPGFRGSGSSIATATVYRKIKGRALLRKQYKTQSTDVNGRFITQSGSDFTVLVALADVIYAGSTIVSAKVAAGFYTNGSAVSNASVAGSLTNASTYAYRKPTAAWLNHQHLRATGDFPVEMIAFHRHAMGGRQVAGIRFQARDTTGNVSAEQVVTGIAPSSLITATGAKSVEAFKATIPVSSLAQGELCYTNAKVYPWIGDASAVYDLSVDGTYTGLTRIVDASPHTRLRFFNDKAGTYSGVAYLDANATGTGAVAATLASAKSTPYATVQAAFAGIKAYNAARGHDDYAGGRIYLGNNSGSTIEYGPTANIPNASAPGATWCEILVDPAITSPVKWTGKGTVINIPSMTRAVGLTIKPGGTNQTTFQDGDTASNASMLSLESCVYEAPSAGFNIAGGEGIRGWSIQYRSNVTSTLGNVLNMTSGGTTVQGLALALGNVQPQGGQPAPAQIFVANRSECPSDANSAMPAYTDGYFWVSNEWRFAAGPALNLLSKTRPTVLVNNLGEARGNNSTIIAFNMAADGITSPVYELLDMHNTFVGNRGSRMYSDRAESRGVVKEGVSIGSVYGNYNFKTDSFDPTQNGSGLPGNTGNWRYGYQVGTRSNISLSGSLGGSVPNLQASYLGMAWEPDYSTYLVSSTFANVAALFVDYQALRNDQSSYPGGGNYHAASSTNALANRTPAVFASFNADFTDTISGAVVSRDLDGNVRRTDGTGAAGCYES